MLTACASDDGLPEGGTSAGSTTERVGASDAEALRDPELRDELAEAQARLEAGEAATAEGRLDEAEAHYLAALQGWPISLTAWRGLEDVYARQDRPEDLSYARFFAARMTWANDQPPLIAAAAFDNLAAGRTEWEVPDARYVETAAGTRDFLHAIDREGRFRPPAEGVPWYLAIVPSGVLTAILLASVGAG